MRLKVSSLMVTRSKDCVEICELLLLHPRSLFMMLTVLIFENRVIIIGTGILSRNKA